MKKIRILYLIATSIAIFTACGNKYSVENLKKNNNLLKETVQKCKIKRDEKICKNVEKAQSELALEAWNKVKPEIEAKLDKISKEIQKGNLAVTAENMPEKFWEYEAKLVSITPKEAKELIIKILNETGKELKNSKFTYDLLKVQTGRTSIGRNYAIIPTESEFSFEEKKISGKQKTLVFEEEGKWYIINLDKKYTNILKEMYPDLTEIKTD